MCDLPALATLTLANFYFLALAFVSAYFFVFWFFFFFFFLFVLHLLKKDITDFFIHIHAAHIFGLRFHTMPCSM